MTDHYFDETLRRWIAMVARNNVHRIAGCDVNDLIQEGMVSYYKCRDRYVGKCNLRDKDGRIGRYMPKNAVPSKSERKHFISLFQRAYLNRIASMARDTPSREVPVSSLVTDDSTAEEFYDSVLPPDPEVATVTAMIAQAPKELKQLVDLFVREGVELANIRGRKISRGRRIGGRRETTDAKLCRLIGCPTFPIRDLLNHYFAI